MAARKKKQRPDPPGSTLSKEKSLRLLRESCEISDEIILVVPDSTQRANAPPPGYFIMYENFVEHCLLWFPLPGFLLRYLEANDISLAQINPRGLRHIIGIYVLSRECNVEISTEQLSCLLDIRLRGRTEELRYLVSLAVGSSSLRFRRRLLRQTASPSLGRAGRREVILYLEMFFLACSYFMY